jgi:AraC-like DNA-binding protein/mannose-6-phosphate isomerase-like protein (cupin superfamily)
MLKARFQQRLRCNSMLQPRFDVQRSRIIGSAVEINGGHLRERPCYGTYHGDIPDASFRFNITVVKHQGAFPIHSHEYVELVIVLSGRAMHLTNYGNHALEDGDVVVINRHTRHGFSEAHDLTLCNIMYDPAQFLSGHRDLDKMMGYHALFDLEPRARRSEFKERLHLSTEELVYVTSLISTLKSEFDSQYDGRKTSIRCTFLLLVTQLSRLYARQKEHASTANVRMANVMSYIQTHYREPLPLEDLARLAHWSPSQFRRNFKRIYNTSPIKFISQVRLHEACEMLKDPNRDITDVAMETGFSSSSFFATQFRNYLGESPSQYRRRKLSEIALQRQVQTPLRASC